MTISEEIKADCERDLRAEMISSIRALASFLEIHPDVPVEYILAYSYPSLAQARKATHLSGAWDKSFNGSLVDYDKSIGSCVKLSMSVMRSEVCTRVQTGVKHVEAVPAHDEPVYEWKCAPENDEL
jgi:hypothetical protein